LDNIVKKNKKNGHKHQNHYNDDIIDILTSDSILSDVMLGKSCRELSYKSTGRRNIDRSSDNYLVYCSSCNKVWEDHYRYKPVVYHDNVPTYGKKRIKCKICKEENKNGQNN
tara:strand:- start:433 stop:768 length:336 start_codon:yes stop_codon:yes gene_type:complete